MLAAEARGTVADELQKIPAADRAKSSVFFWTQQQGGASFKNTATQSALKAAPQLPRGGILGGNNDELCITNEEL